MFLACYWLFEGKAAHFLSSNIKQQSVFSVAPSHELEVFLTTGMKARENEQKKKGKKTVKVYKKTVKICIGNFNQFFFTFMTLFAVQWETQEVHDIFTGQ